MEKRIVFCKITKVGFRNEVNVVYDDGTGGKIFAYYPDELSFAECEFVGLTKDEALELFTHRDMAYLRS